MVDTLEKLHKKIYIIDFIIIFLNISTSYSIVPYLIFSFSNRYINMLIIVFINLVYLLKNKSTKIYLRLGILSKLYFVIMTLCFISAFSTNTGWSSVLAHLLQNCTFLLVLYRIYNTYIGKFKDENTLKLIIRPYLTLILISAVGASVLFVLLKCGLSPYVNNVSDRYDLFGDNVEKFGVQYYYPYFISIIDPDTIDLRFPFFGDCGAIDGLFHEPHCMTFMSFPALFLLLYYSSNNLQKMVIWLIFIMQMGIAGSTTNIASSLVCLIIYMFYTFKNSLKKTIALGVLIMALSMLIISYIDFSTFDFIFNKIESGSMTYSVSTIDFAMQPRTLLGTSFLNLGYLNSSSLARKMDVGFIPFVLNVIFLFVCMLKVLKLFKSRGKFQMCLMLSCTYFFAHSAKVAMVAYSLSMLVFIIFLLDVVTHKNIIYDFKADSQ